MNDYKNLQKQTMTFQQFIETKYPLLKGRDFSDINWSLEQVLKVVEEWQSTLNGKGEQNPKP